MPTDAAHWDRLIEAVAARQDRAAFAQLFEHFAPRIKTFMRRSGASEGSADELAQETLLAVWRKAALFESSAAGAAAWIFTIARNLRIDALRRERRSNETSDVDAEFQVDESPSRIPCWRPPRRKHASAPRLPNFRMSRRTWSN